MKIKDFVIKYDVTINGDEEYLDYDLLLVAVVGSVSYGTNTPTSDIDYKGIFISPHSNLMGLNSNYIPQINFENNDIVFYEIGRFMELLAISDFGMLELIHADTHLIYRHSMLDELIKNRNKFITKQCKNRVGGYAIGQINKAKGQDKFQNWNKNKTIRKSPLDFITVYEGKTKQPLTTYLSENKINQKDCGLVQVPHTYDKLIDFMTYHNEDKGKWYSLSFHISKLLQSLAKYGVINLDATQNAVNNKLYHIETILTTIKANKNNITYKQVNDLSNAYKQVLQPFYKANKIDDKYKYLMTYALFYDKEVVVGKYKGIVKEYDDGTFPSNELRMSNISKTEQFKKIVSYDMNAYSTHCKDYGNYQTWLKERNEQRWVDNNSHKQLLDGKNMGHCVRLLTISKEIAQGKGLILHRPDRDYLLSIRRGEVDLQTLIETSKKEIKEIDLLYKDSKIADAIDINYVNELLVKIRNNYYI